MLYALLHLPLVHLSDLSNLSDETDLSGETGPVLVVAAAIPLN